MKRLLCTAIFVFLFSLPVFAYTDFPMSSGDYGSVVHTASYTFQNGMSNGDSDALSVQITGHNVTQEQVMILSASADVSSVQVVHSRTSVRVYAQNDVSAPVTITVNYLITFRASTDLASDPFTGSLINMGSATSLGWTYTDLYNSVMDILSVLSIGSAHNSAITPISYLSSADDFYIYCDLPGVSVSDGLWSVSQSFTSSNFTWNGVVDWSLPYPGNAYFIAGQQYLVSLSWVGTVSSLDSLQFMGQGSVDNVIVSTSTSGSSSSTRSVLSFVYTPSVNSLCAMIRFSGAQFSFNPGEVSWSVIPADMESIAGSAVPDEWEDTNQQLDSAASDLHSVDETVFTDINTYKGQLDFGLDSWSDAAAGLSYVGNIFLILWDNIPTQPIVLALMLGLASLLLGRGAALARRAGRGRRGGDDDA